MRSVGKKHSDWSSRVTRPLTPLEKVLQRDILAYLLTLGFMAWRQNSGAAKIGGRLIRFGFAGLADIGGIAPDGRAIAVEVKRLTGKASEAQRDFLADVNSRGAVGILAFTMDDVDERLRKEGYLSGEGA